MQLKPSLGRMLCRRANDEVSAGVRAEAVRGLAALLRSGLPLRSALLNWHEHAPPDLRDPLMGMARRIRLGAANDAALGPLQPFFGRDTEALSAVLVVVSESGGDAPSMLEGIASSIQNRAALAEAGRAAGSGALLSGRLVAGLPLAFVPLMPLAKVAVFDGPGLVLLGLGVALAFGGLRWVSALMPLPPPDDGAAAVADVAAAVLVGGTSLQAALRIAGRQAPESVAAPMQRATRLVALGLPWPEALGRLDDAGLRELAAILRMCQKFGLPVSVALRAFATRRREEQARRFEAATRRAPVLMVIPLVTCVLPSYLLLGLGPFLRTLTLT
ncbi:MAG: type II secretion system F family protein [Actinobacteria bacterium]|nr:type II secretion system F family protein [Actinomycetota bacterium]